MLPRFSLSLSLSSPSSLARLQGSRVYEDPAFVKTSHVQGPRVCKQLLYANSFATIRARICSPLSERALLPDRRRVYIRCNTTSRTSYVRRDISSGDREARHRRALSRAFPFLSNLIIADFSLLAALDVSPPFRGGALSGRSAFNENFAGKRRERERKKKYVARQILARNVHFGRLIERQRQKDRKREGRALASERALAKSRFGT